MMDDEKAKKLGQSIKANLQVGKDGISEGMVDEINKQVEDKGLVKIKVLRNSPYLEMEEAVDEIHDRCKARVVEVRGRTVLLTERRS